jgi:hypothetical protein
MATPTAQFLGLTGDVRIDGLTQGSAWTFGSGQRVITYSLDLTGYQVSSWTQGRIAAIDQVFQAFSTFIDVQFQRVGTTFGSQALSNADLAIGLAGNYNYTSSALGITSLGVFPDPTFAGLVRSILPGYNSNTTNSRVAGDIFFNDGDSVFAGDWARGSAGFLYAMHEVGHALGLKHPFDTGATDQFPGYPVHKNFQDYFIGAADDGYHTIMSYNDVTSSITSGNNVTPMPYDILALQRLYGANMSYHTGNDTYTITNRNPATIWDAGGTDLIDGSTSSEAVWIDLRPGAMFPGIVFNGQTTPGYSIAFNVTIENAQGSGFGDTIWGNSAVNTIDGGAGGDSIDGQGGDDLIQGGLGNDRFRTAPDGGLDTITDAGGFDTLAVVGTPGTVRVRRSGDDLYVIWANDSFQGAYLPSYFTLGDKQIEQLNFTGGGNLWDGNTVWNASQIASGTTLNVAPVVTAAGPRNTLVSEWHRLSEYVTVSDANGDAQVRFEFTDGNAGGGSGQFWFQGSFLAQGATVTLNTSDLSQVWVRGGSENGTDAITVRASDGFSWSGAASFDFVTRGPNRAPVVIAPATQGLPVGNTVAASTLFSVSDADGDAVTQYQFYDGGSGGGQFRVNGVGQGALQNITVNAADIGSTVYAAGGTPGSETLWVRVNDGTVWSEWKSWTEQTQRVGNVLPVLSAPGTRNAEANQWIKLSDIVSLTDADGDAMNRFEVTDGNAASGSGRLWYAGSYLTPNSTVTVNTSDLSQIWVQGGSATGTDTMSVRAHDGFGFGNTVSFDLVTRGPNRTPVVTAPASQGLGVGTTVQASTLFSVTDADNDTMVQYQFYDGGAGGGQFRVNGTGQASGVSITVDAANLANTVYAAGSSQGSETLWVRVNDGIAWSEWKSWTEQSQRTTNAGAPQIGGQATRNSEVQQWHQLSSFLNVTDADGDRPVSFRIVDNDGGAGSGELYANGRTLSQSEGAAGITVMASDLSGVWVRGGTNTGHNTFSVTADDGLANGVGNTFTFDLHTRAPNRAPVVTAPATQGLGVGTTVQASTLFSVTDADNDTITQYQFYDGGAGGGQFRVNGVGQASGVSITVDAANLANTVYAAGGTQGTETLWVRVNDGIAWSEWKSWTEQSQRTTNVLPALSAPATRNAEANQWIKLSDIVTVTDADGDAMNRFEVTDGNSASGSGRLWYAGNYLAPGSAVTVATSDLAQIWVQGGSATGTDTMSVRAHDGFGFGNTVSFDLVTRGPNRAPVVTVPATQGLAVGTTVQASTLFSVTDADNDTITQYQFYDGGAGGGQFRVNGVGQASGASITVNAANLASTTYAAGATQGSETLWVRVNDGIAWSEWKSWTEQSQRTSNTLPVVSGSAPSRLDVNAWYRLSDFVSVVDGDNDAMESFEISDLGNTAGGAYLFANGADVAQGGTVVVNASNLQNVWVRGGSTPGTDTITVRAHDGFGYGNTASFNLTTRFPNRAPVVSVQDFATGLGQSMPVTRLFSASDADNDAIQTYRFWDSGTGGGFFSVNGVAQPVRQNIDVSAADLANTVYVGGNQATQPNAGERLSVQVFDGTAWSDWKTFSMSSATLARFTENIGTPNADTRNTAQDGVYYGLGGNDTFAGFGGSFNNESATFFVGGSGGDSYNVGNLNNFSYVLENGDSSGDSLTFQTFNIGNVGNSGAGIVDGRHLVLFSFVVVGGPGAHIEAGVVFIFDWEKAANRIETFNVGSGSFSYEQFRTRLLATNPETFTYADLGSDGGVLNEEIAYYRERSAELDQPNRAPVIAPAALAQTLAPNQTVQASTLFTATDPDGDLVTRYEFTDLGAGGTLRFDGNVVTGPLDVQAGDLNRVTYRAGANGTSDTLRVRGNDGVLWGAPADIALQSPNHPITMVPLANSVRPGVTIPIRNLVSFSDADNDAIASVEITDLGAANGTLMYQGNAVAPNTTLTLTWAQTADLSYIGGALGTTDTLRVRAHDGIEWSQPFDRTISPVANQKPVVVANGNVLRGSATADGIDQRVALGGLITQAVDVDGDLIQQYEFTDGAGASSGYLMVNGVAQAQGATVTLTQSQLASSYYVAGSSTDNENLAIRAYDGFEWSNPATSTVTTVLNNRPVVIGADFTSTPGRLLYTSEFFSAADFDGSNLTIDLRAPLGFNGFGSVNGVDQGNPRTWHIPGFANFGFSVSAADGTYTLSARAFDGIDWSAWEDITFTVATPVDGAGNTTGSARSVTLTSAPQTFADWVGSGDGMDYYRFTVNGSERVVIRMNPADYGSSLTVQLLDAQGNNEMSPMIVSYSGSPATHTTASLEAGEYFVSVTGGSSYSLQLSSQASAPFDGAGNQFSEARQVTNLHTEQTFQDYLSGAGTAYFDSVDYYRFTLAPGQILNLGLDNITSAGNVQVRFMGNGSSSIDPYTFVNGSQGSLDATLTNNTATSQDYYLQLVGFFGDANNYAVTFWANNLPKFTSGTRSVSVGETIPGVSLFTATDADLDPVTQFHLIDNNAAAGSGYFTLDGVQQQAGQQFTVNAADIGLLQFHAGSAPTVDDIAASGYDGHEWGLWWHWNIDTIVVPADLAGNDFASGRVVALTSTPQVFTDWVGSADAADIYTFTYAAEQSFHMVYTGTNPNAMVRVEVYQSDGGTAGNLLFGPGDVAGQTPLDLFMTPFPVGTYSLRITPLLGSNTDYSLSLSTS